MLARVSPDDTDFGYHGVRVEGWNRASADNADLAEAHGGWKPGNASRYSRFHLGDVFNIFPRMVQAPEPAAPMVACWAAAPPAGSDDEVEDDEENEDEDDEADEEPEPVAMPTPGVNLQPGGALVGAATVASPIGRALNRLQRLLN